MVISDFYLLKMPAITPRHKELTETIRQVYGDRVDTSVRFLIADVVWRQEKITEILRELVNRPEVNANDIIDSLNQLEADFPVDLQPEES
jgi:hypothetical protein